MFDGLVVHYLNSIDNGSKSEEGATWWGAVRDYMQLYQFYMVRDGAERLSRETRQPIMIVLRYARQKRRRESSDPSRKVPRLHVLH